MHDDESMDHLLRDAMAEDVPRLSPAFDARVMRTVRPRRLTPLGRVVIGAYILAAAVTTTWLMKDLPVQLVAAALAISVPVAAAVSAYGRRLAVGE